MKKILATHRLILREFELGDAENMWALNADEEVVKYTGDAAFKSVESARTFLQNYDTYKKTGVGRWAVVLKTTGEFIGWCGLKKHPEGFVDIGFRFFQKHWGRGYATESAKACLQYAFTKLQLPEIIGRAAKANTASIKVLQKLNMQYWKDAPCDGIADAAYYKIVNPTN